MSKFSNYDIIRSPVVTEKSTLASEHGQIVFDVASAKGAVEYSTGAFTGSAGELRYSQSGGNTYVSGGINGDGVADESEELVSGLGFGLVGRGR